MTHFDPENTVFLPQEIWESIIDCSTNLLSCALVCSSWTQRSQRNIFRRIRVRDEHQLRKLLDTLAIHPAFGRYINSIDLPSLRDARLSPKRRKRDQALPGVDSTAPWPFLILVELAPYLAELKHLTITGHRRHAGRYSVPIYLMISTAYGSELTLQSFVDALSSVGRSVRILDLSVVRFPSLEDFTKFLLMFPNLHTLRQEQADVLTIGESQAVPAPFVDGEVLPRLECLTLSHAPIAFCQFILNRKLHSQLLSILEVGRVNCSPSSSLASTLGEVISLCGPRLRKLGLVLINVLKLGRDGLFSFKANTSLRALSIKQCAMSLKDHRRTQRLHWLVDLLSTLPQNTQLQDLNVEICMPSNPHGTDDDSLIPQSKLANDFAQLDSLFMSLKDAKTIIFSNSIADGTLDYDGSSLIVTGHVSQGWKLFPMSTARGILEYRAGPKTYGRDDGIPEPDSDNDI